MYDLRFIRQVLYSLRRDYGLPVNIVWDTASTPDYETGKKVVVRDSLTVNRAIIMPASIQRDFVYDLTVIASNKNFTYGGLFDQRSRRIIIDRQDIPKDFEIKIGYHAIIKGQRFEIKGVQAFDDLSAFVLDAEQVDNIELANHIQKQMYSLLLLNHTVEVTLNA